MTILGVDIHHILWKCRVHGDAILQMDYAHCDIHFLVHFFNGLLHSGQRICEDLSVGSSLEEGCFH